jgi:hypothetical protein
MKTPLLKQEGTFGSLAIKCETDITITALAIDEIPHNLI